MSKAMNNRFQKQTFGQELRALRMEKGVTLRAMARLMEVTPTYLSQVEQDKYNPPTEDRIIQMGQILHLSQGQIDELVVMAGRVSENLRNAVTEHPREMATFLRAAQGLNAEDIRELIKRARKLRKGPLADE